MCGATAAASHFACASVTPGFIRPIIVMMLPQSRGGPYKFSGVIASTFAPGENTAPKSKLAGSTPITVV